MQSRQAIAPNNREKRIVGSLGWSQYLHKENEYLHLRLDEAIL